MLHNFSRTSERELLNWHWIQGMKNMLNQTLKFLTTSTLAMVGLFYREWIRKSFRSESPLLWLLMPSFIFFHRNPMVAMMLYYMVCCASTSERCFFTSIWALFFAFSFFAKYDASSRSHTAKRWRNKGWSTILHVVWVPTRPNGPTPPSGIRRAKPVSLTAPAVHAPRAYRNYPSYGAGRSARTARAFS